jgi:putative ABC transport system permease protein
MQSRLVRKSLLGNPRLLVWTVATLTASSALACMFTTVSLEVGRKMSGALRSLGANAVVHRTDGNRLPSDRGAAATSPAGDWRRVEQAARGAGAELLVVRLRVGSVQGAPLAVAWARPEGLEAMTPYWSVTGARAAEAGECAVGRSVAERFDLEPGDQLSLEWPDREGSPGRFRVAGVFEAGDEDDARIYLSRAPEPDADTATGTLAYGLLSVPGGEAGIARVRAHLSGSGYALKPLRQVLHGERSVLDRVRLLSALALAVVLVLTSLGVTASALARVVERRREFALMQALGATRRAIRRHLLAESAAVGALASLGGFLLGTVLAEAVTLRVFGVPVEPRAAGFGAALLVALGVALPSGLTAARHILRLPPAAVLGDTG